MALTIVEKILLAAHALEESGSSPFTAEELIVKAWQMDKDLFGLQGHANDHPDSNRILTNIMGSKGLKGKGWIERVGEKQYQLTAAGSRMALRLATADTTAPTRAGTLPRKEVLVVRRLMNSPAFKKTMNNDETIIFRDACNFWGISSYSDAATLRDRFTEIRDVMEDLEKAISESPTGVITLPDMKVVLRQDTVRTLRETHKALQKGFFNELEVVRKRGVKKDVREERSE